MTIIAPSVLSADLGRLAEEVKAMEEAGADWFHVDIMDGSFVPNITFGPWMVGALRKATRLPLDVHLMVAEPLTWAPVFAGAGADYVSVHVETTPHLDKCLESIVREGAKPALALNPSTGLGALDEIWDRAEMIVLMGVNPGFSGQKYVPSTTAKAGRLKRYLAELNAGPLVEVDGGVSDDNAGALTANGVGVLVSGSHLFRGPDYKESVASLRRRAALGLPVKC
ncbi:MAG: ribulose-phosphate 3-epimerase [Deltaproteobacteria bacterium]|jgi:ribulose-phosphate 3-epimerase|nr:ribulose-phosphate 3-epimerase [Deltaproteobacteria bacterium]